MGLNGCMEKPFIKARLQEIILSSGKKFQLEILAKNQIRICDQNVLLKDKTEIVTVDYIHHKMIGFQFKKTKQCLQYRSFEINTISNNLIKGEWVNIIF